MASRHLVQRSVGPRYTDLFRHALVDRQYADLAGAVAYATVGGVAILEKVLSDATGPSWPGLRKRWLVGVDWCRSDPPALARLSQLPTSEVRVPGGAAIVTRAGCSPSVTFHPKLYLLSGDQAQAVICGSGNLSANALLRGCECGHLLTEDRGPGPDSDPHVTELSRWFEEAWDAGTPYDSIADAYERRCIARIRSGALAPTEDDEPPPLAGGGSPRAALTDQQLRELRTFPQLWVEAGALGANLGQGRPGNQLDMKRFTRVFFGVAPLDVPNDTELRRVTLIWRGEPYPDRTLRYANNGMDKLNVPPVADPRFYENKTLLLRRRDDGSFDFEVGGARLRKDWLRRSRTGGAVYTMSPGRRRWGLF